MAITLYASTGCLRCSIVKEYLKAQGTAFSEHDIQNPEGNAAFKKFYAQHRAHIRRDAHGIFFPLVQDGDHIVQDAGSTLAWFIAGESLHAMIRPNNMGHGWTGGLHIGAGNADCYSPFLQVIRLLKAGGLRTAMDTDGNNAPLLHSLLAEALIDRLHVRVTPPSFLSPAHRAACEASFSAACAALKAASQTVSIHFYTDIAAPDMPTGTGIHASDVGAAAEWLNAVTHCNTLPYTIRDSASTQVERNLLPFRTAARRWQTGADIDKAASIFQAI